MALPTPYTVEQLPWTNSGTDPHGNPVEGYGDPVPVKVHGWSVPQSSETDSAVADRVIVDVKLYCPPGTEVSHRDRFRLPTGGTYDVVGELEDYTHGPFEFRAGVVVNLRRTDG